MSTHLVTFSDSSMSRSHELCEASGLAYSVDVIATPKSYRRFTWDWLLDSDLVERFGTSEFWQGRGCGYWVWKPYVIGRAMLSCEDGDVIIYSDAGVEFIAPVNHIIDRMDQDIFLFGNNYEHAHWCKADVVNIVWPATDKEFWRDDQSGWSRLGKQAQASVIFFRVSDYTRRFVKEWLDWCLFEGGRLIDDSSSRIRNHPEFREHRHDQAILTTLAYREGIKLHYWPASYNDGAFTYEKLPEYASDDYPILFNHHRRRDHEWEQVA